MTPITFSDYKDKTQSDLKEAQRQSLLVNNHKASEESLWEENADFDQWKVSGYKE